MKRGSDKSGKGGCDEGDGKNYSAPVSSGATAAAEAASAGDIAGGPEENGHGRWKQTFPEAEMEKLTTG